ncbi:TIGR00153 family protein [Catenovulum sediminis]|uniref:TIGR00153 family protein n=1 Tax=Catenovulum sediminis TaxID=1740262 RepID=A0ABV1RLB1_9ALTE|nr:TIGR00153 family protein [Catenovulum sediminis]
MTSNSFLGVFGKSPFKALETHIDIVYKASSILPSFFEAVFESDWAKAEELRQQISQYEKDADKLKRDLRIQLPKGLFLPVERTDLLNLLVQQDKIANKAKDIAGRVIGRELPIPGSLQEAFMTYLKRCIDAVALATKAINELDELLETGFRGREVDLVEKIISEVEIIEEDTDKMQISLRLSVKAHESELSPIDAIFLYDVIEWVGDLADRAESVGGRLELLLAR